MTEYEKNFITLGKGYLSLIYLMCQYEIAGNNPPDDLKIGIENLERQIRIMTATRE